MGATRSATSPRWQGWLTFSSLTLWNNQISDITPLAGLANLQQLDLGGNQISDITPLAGLTNLDSLSLGVNQISNTTPLAGLINLGELYLWVNQISDITPLAGLTNLEYLYLEYNQISDITPLAGLSNLNYLDLSVNQISSITPLAGLTNLGELYLWANQISDITPLSGLTNLQDLDIANNYINISPGSPAMVIINNLISAGVNVTYEPQSDADAPIELPEQLDVDIDQMWRINFNREFSKDEVEDIYIDEVILMTTLTNGVEEFIDVDVEWLSEAKQAIITPKENYTPDETYYLRIDLSNGNQYQMKFTVVISLDPKP